jgi:hypothetical protein
MSHAECQKLSNISVNTAVAIFLDEYVKVGHFWKHYTEQAVDSMAI